MKKKILHIQLLPLLSGVQNVMLQILENLDQNKYEIFVLSKSGGPLVERLESMNIKHIPVDSLCREFSISDFKAFWKIYKICRNYKFDIVHTHSSKTGFLGRIAAKFAGTKKIIHTSHGFPFNQFQTASLRTFYKICEKFAGLFCDFVVFVNEHDKNYAIENNIICREKALTVYNGIECPLEFKKKGQSNRFIIGSSFRFWKQKNPIQTVEAAINVCHRNSRIDFVFLGDGELLENCRQIVIKADLQKRILFKGWVSNIFDHLAEFDVFLLYSKWEGLPVSILEAMAAGLPIVASDIVGNNELVDETNGILVPINDIDRLVDHLVILPTKMDQIELWGKGSLKKVKIKFSMQNFINQYKRIYEN